MKLILAIVNPDDAETVMDALYEKNIQVTKLATTGGLLKAGNTTLIIGLDDEKVKEAVEIIEEYSSKRQQMFMNSGMDALDISSSVPFPVTTGGATIFVLNIDEFKKV